jgi:hypothetical protein
VPLNSPRKGELQPYRVCKLANKCAPARDIAASGKEAAIPQLQVLAFQGNLLILP